jgi:hypothetical protein
MHSKYHPESSQNQVRMMHHECANQHSSHQTPFPKRNVLMLLSMYLRNVFGYGRHGKLWDAFKY